MPIDHQQKIVISGMVIAIGLRLQKNLMKRSLVLLLMYLLPVAAIAQVRSETLQYKIGDNIINIEVSYYGKSSDIAYINLHADETTSVDAARSILQTGDGILIRILNEGKRNIRFTQNNVVYTFDPNRMFSKTGIERTLSRHGKSHPDAVREIQQFAEALLAQIPSTAQCIIALHNNTEGGLSIGSYMPGGEYAGDASDVYASDAHDPDDFFLTTDSPLFQQLKSEKFNVVLQDNDHVQQDGSLSVYFGEMKRRYLNCETQHGKTAIYGQMLAAAIKHLESPVSR